MADNPYPIHIGKQAFSELFIGFSAIFFVIIFFAIYMIPIFGSLLTVIERINLSVAFIILPLLGFLIFIFAFSFLSSFLYLNTIKYSITSKEFNLKGGIITRFERILPYQKIQHAIITRSFTQRIFGLSTVVIQTGSHNIGVDYNRNRNQDTFAGNPKIPGLDFKDAEKLKNYIIEQVLRTKSGQGI